MWVDGCVWMCKWVCVCGGVCGWSVGGWSVCVCVVCGWVCGWGRGGVGVPCVLCFFLIDYLGGRGGDEEGRAAVLPEAEHVPAQLGDVPVVHSFMGVVWWCGYGKEDMPFVLRRWRGVVMEMRKMNAVVWRCCYYIYTHALTTGQWRRAVPGPK